MRSRYMYDCYMNGHLLVILDQVSTYFRENMCRNGNHNFYRGKLVALSLYIVPNIMYLCTSFFFTYQLHCMAALHVSWNNKNRYIYRSLTDNMKVIITELCLHKICPLFFLHIFHILNFVFWQIGRNYANCFASETMTWIIDLFLTSDDNSLTIEKQSDSIVADVLITLIPSRALHIQPKDKYVCIKSCAVIYMQGVCVFLSLVYIMQYVWRP
jgi:hypothetical protein